MGHRRRTSHAQISSRSRRPSVPSCSTALVGRARSTGAPRRSVVEGRRRPAFRRGIDADVLDATNGGKPQRSPADSRTLCRGLLVSRLDRLSPGALETIHLASAFSRSSASICSPACRTRPSQALREDLHELVRSGLMYRSRARAGETYLFKHALVADAAYDSILRSDRRQLHGQIAHRLPTRFRHSPSSSRNCSRTTLARPASRKRPSTTGRARVMRRWRGVPIRKRFSIFDEGWSCCHTWATRVSGCSRKSS